MATEATPILKQNPPVLVLAPHARLGRQISTSVSLVFLFGFHAALLLVALLNWDAPCDEPLQAFLLSFGVLGLVASTLYLLLEVLRDEEHFPSLPPVPSGFIRRLPPVLADSGPKCVALLLLVLASAAGVLGTLSVLRSSSCSASAPVVYKWAFAAALAFCIFLALVAMVPLLSLLMPVLAVLLAPFIAALAACAAWMNEAGRRGAWGSASALQRMLGLAAPEAETLVVSPTSRFALYVNSTALCWFFGYLLLEVRAHRDMPCDVPLHAFVGVLGAAGLGLTLADFMRDVFSDPMPPLTKLEHARAKQYRRGRLLLAAYLLAALLLWGVCGLAWLRSSTSCAHTAPPIYRLALLLAVCFVVLCALLGLLLLILSLDFCCSGRLRMVIVFER